MAQDDEQRQSSAADLAPLHEPQVAEYEFSAGPIKVRAAVRVTPLGILAIGAMVTGILLATSSVVWSSTSAARIRAGRPSR